MYSKFKLKFLTLLCISSFCSETYSQNPDLLFTSIDQYKSYIFAKHLEPINKKKDSHANQKLQLEKSIFQKNELPLFCKMEFLINQKSQIPVKIRLGDVEYVDMLESKAILYKVKQ